MRTSFFVLILTVTVLAKYDSTFSLRINTQFDSAKLKIANWERRINAVPDEKIAVNNDKEKSKLIILGDLDYFAMSYKIKVDSVSIDSSNVTMTWKSFISKEDKEYYYPKMGATFKQEFGTPIENGKLLKRKSLAIFTGLSLINGGIGDLYLKKDNFVYKLDYSIIAAHGAIDAVAAAVVISNPKERMNALKLMALCKLFSIYGIPVLNLHNKISESGYEIPF